LPLVAKRASIRDQATALGNTSVLADLESQQLLIETHAELEITRSKIAFGAAARAHARRDARTLGRGTGP